MTRKTFLKGKKTSIVLLVVTAAIVVSALLSPASSISANPCAQCHGQYYEYLDIREGDSRNQLPTSISVGENKTVTVVVQNVANTVANALLSSVSLTLRSKNGHFSVKQATFNVPGLLQWGTTKNATWEITGISVGTDTLLISATEKTRTSK